MKTMGMGLRRVGSLPASARVTHASVAYESSGKTLPGRRAGTAPPLPPLVAPLPTMQYTQHGLRPRTLAAEGPPPVYTNPRPYEGFVCESTPDGPISDPVMCWRLECSTSRDEPMELLRFRAQVSNGTVDVSHYAALQTARAWAEEAQRLLSRESRIGLLDRVLSTGVNISTSESVRAVYEEQVRFVREVFEAIANYYNALNIPWSNDPEARRIYRKWLAGTGGLSSEYVQSADYNGGNWYSKDHIEKNVSNYPFITNSPNGQQGILVRRARRFHQTMQPGAKTHFRQLAGVRMTGSGSDWNDPRKSPYVFAQQATNEAFAYPNGLSDSYVPKDAPNGILEEDVTGWMPRSSTGRRYNARDGWVGRTRVMRLPPDRVTDIQDGQFSNDWRAYGHTSYLGIENPQQAAAPLRDYLDWAREWVAALTSRTPSQVLRESRSNVLRYNLGWVTRLGGVDRFASTIAGQNAEIERELKSGTTTEVVGAVTGGLVRSLGAVIPGVGPQMANMIGGATDAIFGIFSALINDGSITSFGRDDLGNFKPVMERSFLSGDINSSTPPPAVRAPAWFCRDESFSAQSELTRTDPPASSLYLSTHGADSGPVAVLKVLAVVALTAGAAAGGIWATRRR